MACFFAELGLFGFFDLLTGLLFGEGGSFADLELEFLLTGLLNWV